MGKLIVTEFLTLDGVAQAPGGREEDQEQGFEHGGWQAPLMDAAAGAAIFDNARGMDALLLGRRTYDIFAGYWPQAPDGPFTELLNRVPKYVASRTLSEPLEWRNSSLLDGEVADAVAQLKQRHEAIHVIGSLDLTQTLLRHRLIDRLELWFHPLALGSGKRVFATGTVPTAFRLLDATPYASGSVLLAYALAGTPTYGTIGA
ncbi:dihydrofolate reductase family protein [Conexibacter sp. JD483]|uniref:dihydrofolate reductase family protein n=1 Tax=unclassified Conexibacter TaxID=2627773 RepID=UPI00271A3435|nr:MULTISPECIES: dihydrofolate reductase family protein [unclassified Conexibacter]MDO8189079.1 dihydrofolate reductase family protein [Conexibacter sp. CPCC 205706]MDO8201874.1 dihydrofolate reductase family protein [Conexibacter sp. CPCC 205762]MDR9372513.1 dihydrofolate reductase family protein [Conexibacter sp. JD483]